MSLIFRYDKDGLGAIFTYKYLRKIGVNDSKLSKAHTARELPTSQNGKKTRPKSENGKSCENKENVSTKTSDNKHVENDNNNKQDEATINNPKMAVNITRKTDDENEEQEPKAKIIKIPKKKKHNPKLENIIDCLHYKVCAT